MGNLFKLCFLLFALSASVFVSCTPEDGGDGNLETVPLPSPSVTVQEQDETSFTLAWSPVSGADHYSYRCDWTEDSSVTQDTVLSFMDLVPDSTYVVWLSAVPSSDADMFRASPEAEISVTLSSPENPQGRVFTIEISDNPDMMMVEYTIVPDDDQMLFYRDCFYDAQWEEMGGNPEDVWTSALQGYIDFFGDSWMYMVAESGTVQSYFDYYYDQHTYILVAGIDSLANRITPVVDTMFYSGPVPPSDITFDIVVSDVGVSSAVVSVEPSNDDPWSMLMIEGDMEDYSEQDMKDLLKYTYSEYINDGHVYSGYLEMKYGEGTLDPDTEYTVMVFGWNTALSTDIDTVRVRTDKASSSADLTFDWLIEVQGPMEIHAVVTPSDLEAQYIVIPMPDYDYEEFGTDINAYLDYVTMGMITPYEYAYMFAATGVTDKVFDEWNDGIYPESSYMFMAVGVDMNNSTQTVEFYSPQTYGEMVTTPSE